MRSKSVERKRRGSFLLSPTEHKNARTPVFTSKRSPNSPFADRTHDQATLAALGALGELPELSLAQPPSPPTNNLTARFHRRTGPLTFSQQFLLFEFWRRFDESRGTVYNLSWCAATCRP